MGKISDKDDVIRLKCLNCEDVEMDRMRLGKDLVLDRCSECGGLWFDFTELIELKELGSFYIKHLEKGEHKRGEENRIRECPRCGLVLQPSMLGKDQTIRAERCPGCKGIWLDNGELSKLTGSL